MVTGYAITFGGFLILGERAADLFGRCRMFMSGMVLGGVLVQFTSWRSVFLVNVLVGVAAVLLAPKLLGESRHERGPGRPRLDAGGALLVTIAVAEVVNGGEVAGAIDDRAAMLAGGRAAVVATVVAWRART